MQQVLLRTTFAEVMLRHLQLSGAPLAKILAAGQWRSAAFLKYLDECDLEKEVAFEATVHSDDEEWID